MPAAIGLRAYRFWAQKKNSRGHAPADPSELNTSVPDFVQSFIASHKSTTNNSEVKRSWSFDEKVTDSKGNTTGHVKYGTYGFESTLRDNRTMKANYRRKTNDIEEIPLFYEFWFPDGEDYGFLCMQSFQGRSCITLLVESIRDKFEEENQGYYFRIKKLMPNDLIGSLYKESSVKNLRLIKASSNGDIADNFIKADPDDVNFEFVWKARRNKSLGSLKSIASSLNKNAAGLVEFEGIEFEQAVADIRVGGKLRRVGIMGPNADAGVIDITDDVVFGTNGHPTFASLQIESEKILTEFYATISGLPS
ncbi:MAG: hypothetical protein LAT81_03590 [Oceanicaulis sp.]|nr:hypothetical protein [Oceanicaulis sp.]